MSDFKIDYKLDADKDSYKFQFGGTGAAARRFFDELILTLKRNWSKFPIANIREEDLPEQQTTLEESVG